MGVIIMNFEMLLFSQEKKESTTSFKTGTFSSILRLSLAAEKSRSFIYRLADWFLSLPFTSGPDSNPTLDQSLSCGLGSSPSMIAWVFPVWGVPPISQTEHFSSFSNHNPVLGACAYGCVTKKKNNKNSK